MRFEFASPARIIFGPGTVVQIGALARELGRRALVTTGLDPAQGERVLVSLAAAGVDYVTLVVSGEPTTDLARQGARLARESGCDLVIGLGGGSAIDAAKAIAALAANGGDPLDYLEVVGRGRSLTQPSLPCIAIPTTAGTGAEVTRNAVLASPEHGIKASLRSATMLPRLALVDPELTHSLPPAVTASTGLDALTQLIEPFTSSKANPLTDALCREGMMRAARSLRTAYEDGRDAARARIWRWPAFSAGWRWRTPAWALSTGLPGRWAARFTRRTAQCVLRSCRTSWPSTRARCAPDSPAVRPWRGTMRSRGS